MRYVDFLTVVLMSVAAHGATSQEVTHGSCQLTKGFDHPTKHSGTQPVFTDQASLFFTAPMAVNTDGAPTSYHPDDPYGSEGKAINTICNGANAILPDGTKLNYSRCRDLVAAYREAKAAGWENENRPRMQFYGVASNGHTPCTIKNGEYSGYFVSTTSLAADPGKSNCDQDRYLNSLDIPFAIYPNARAFKERGVGKKDVVVYFNPANGVVEFGIIGDRGPRWGMAEGSVAFARALNMRTDDPQSRKDTYRFGVAKVHALMLANASLEPPYTRENVRQRAQEAFDDWGGRARFDACVAEHGT